jgi:hypothetical protein
MVCNRFETVLSPALREGPDLEPPADRDGHFIAVAIPQAPGAGQLPEPAFAAHGGNETVGIVLQRARIGGVQKYQPPRLSPVQ